MPWNNLLEGHPALFRGVYLFVQSVCLLGDRIKMVEDTRVSVRQQQHGHIWSHQIMSSVHFLKEGIFEECKGIFVLGGAGGLVGGGVWGSIPPPHKLFLKKEDKSLPKLSMGNRLIGICNEKHLKKFLQELT
jgi:hypothetical protein